MRNRCLVGSLLPMLLILSPAGPARGDVSAGPPIEAWSFDSGELDLRRWLFSSFADTLDLLITDELRERYVPSLLWSDVMIEAPTLQISADDRALLARNPGLETLGVASAADQRAATISRAPDPVQLSVALSAQKRSVRASSRSLGTSEPDPPLMPGGLPGGNVQLTNADAPRIGAEQLAAMNSVQRKSASTLLWFQGAAIVVLVGLAAVVCALWPSQPLRNRSIGRSAN